MPEVLIKGMPPATDARLREMEQAVIDAILEMSVLEVKNEDDVVVFVMPNPLPKPVGEEKIVVDIVMFDKPERTVDVQTEVAKTIARIVRGFCPDAKSVEGLVKPFALGKRGYASL